VLCVMKGLPHLYVAGFNSLPFPSLPFP
jgi:hypothetical protein